MRGRHEVRTNGMRGDCDYGESIDKMHLGPGSLKNANGAPNLVTSDLWCSSMSSFNSSDNDDFFFPSFCILFASSQR